MFFFIHISVFSFLVCVLIGFLHHLYIENVTVPEVSNCKEKKKIQAFNANCGIRNEFWEFYLL